MATNNHLDPDLLSAYLDDEVTPTERYQVENHLQTCAACRRELESLRWTVQMLQSMPAVALPRTFYVTEAHVAPAVSGRSDRVVAWLQPLLTFGTAVSAALFLLFTVGGFMQGAESQEVAAPVVEIARAPEEEAAVEAFEFTEEALPDATQLVERALEMPQLAAEMTEEAMVVAEPAAPPVPEADVAEAPREEEVMEAAVPEAAGAAPLAESAAGEAMDMVEDAGAEAPAETAVVVVEEEAAEATMDEEIIESLVVPETDQGALDQPEPEAEAAEVLVEDDPLAPSPGEDAEMRGAEVEAPGTPRPVFEEPDAFLVGETWFLLGTVFGILTLILGAATIWLRRRS